MFLPLQLIRSQVEVGETTQDSFKCDLRFEPDQRCADTEMDSKSKAQVTPLTSGNVESVGVNETVRIPIRRTDNGVDQVTGKNRFATDFGM